ncbi:MAG: AsmA family protein [Alphaproteobacteria bacterium]|nr:AsmA family protein [Alphaproteobacteria bacterium]
MTKKKKFFVFARAIFLFFAVMFVAIVIALSKMDMNVLRKNLLGVLRSSTGLQIEILGDVSWKLSLRPRVTMRQVTVPNIEGAKHKNLLEAETIEVSLDLISLFSNRPTIQRVKVNDIKVYIDKDKKGNLILPGAGDDDKKSDAPEESDVYTEDEISDYPFVDPGLGGVNVDNMVINIDNEKYKVPGINVRYIARNDLREYRGWIKLNDSDLIPFIVSLDKYNFERKVYPVKFAFSSDGDALIANVALEAKSKMPIDFIVKGDIPDIRPIGNLLNIKFPKMPEMQVDISGKIDDKKFTLHQSSMIVRGNEIDLSGFVDWGKKKTNINLNLSSKKINLKELFPELYGGNPPVNRELNVFHDMPLFGKYMYDNHLSVNVDLGKFVVYRNLSLDNFKVKFNAHDGKVHVDANTKFAAGKVKAAIDGNVEPDGHLYLQMGGIGKSITVGQILRQININNFISDLPLDFEMYVRADGFDMSDIMKTITGPVRVYSTAKGYAHSDLVAYMYGTDFLTSLRHSIQDMFTSDKKYNQMTINGAVANLMLRNGVAEIKNGVAIETNAINIRLGGELNLGEETLNLSLTTVPVRGIKLSITGSIVNTITISGNLAEPDIQISGAAVAGKAISATGIGLLLAPLTGGLGLVAGAGVGLLAGDLLENWLADDHPCETALEKGAAPRRHDPEWMHESAENLANSVLNSGVK